MNERLGTFGAYTASGPCTWCEKTSETVAVTLGIFHDAPLCFKFLAQAIRVAARNGAPHDGTPELLHR